MILNNGINGLYSINIINHYQNTQALAPILQNLHRFRNPQTWGDAVMQKIDKQNLVYRNLYPNGSSITGLGANHDRNF